MKKIRIIKCIAVGKVFDNLIPGSEHDVIKEAYEIYNGRSRRRVKYLKGFWVKGNGEDVVVLVQECEIIG